MHWSGLIRIIALLVAGFSIWVTRSLAGWGWVWSVVLGVAVSFAVPVGIGLVLGFGDRREMKRMMEKAVGHETEQKSP